MIEEMIKDMVLSENEINRYKSKNDGYFMLVGDNSYAYSDLEIYENNKNKFNEILEYKEWLVKGLLE